MTHPANAALRVGRLTVRAAPGGRLGRDVVARQRAEAMLAALSPTIEPADRSILVLRHLHWRLDRLSEAAARETVAAQRRVAARPATGPVRHTVDAVLFADDVELLRCLTRDVIAGRMTQWYWHRLLPDRSGRIGRVLTTAWMERARWVPAVLASLPRNEAVQALRVLTPFEAAQVRKAVLAEFGVPGAASAAAPSSGALPSVSRRPTDGAASPIVEAADPQRQGVRATAPPWAALLPTAPAGLAPDAVALLGVALVVQANPALARRPRFVAELAEWLHHRRIAASAEPYPLPGVTAVDGRPRPAALPNAGDDHDDEPTLPTGDADSAGAGNDEDARPGPGAPPAAPAAEWISKSSPRPADSPPEAPRADGVRTRFASALYLVNVLTWLDLPGSWPAAEPPGGWAIIELLARNLLPPEWARPDDPLWALLAEWDGREPGIEPVADIPAVTVAAASVVELLANADVPLVALVAPGRIVATATNIDVVLDLESIDIAVRSCGLDRDPGWVPDLRRIVAFHFEGGS